MAGRTLTRAAVVVVAVVVVVAGGAVAGGQPPAGDYSGSDAGTEAESGPQVTISDVTVTEGGDAVATLQLSSAPEGLAGFVVEVSSANDTVATVTDAAVQPAFDPQNSTVADGTATLAAADTQNAVSGGETGIRLGTVTVAGNVTGDTDLTVSVERIDDDTGSAVEAVPRNAGVTVVEGPSAAPVVELGDVTVDAGGTATADLRLTDAPDGLAGFVIDVHSDDDSVATVTDAAVDPAFDPRNESIADGTATLAAADTDDAVDPGDTSIRLGNVTVDADVEGTATLSVTLVRIDADDGTPAAALAGTGTVTVTASTGSGPTLPGAAGPAQDVDGDGLLEDINGDGQTDTDDVLDYFDHRRDDVIRSNTAAFDFDGDGAAGAVSDALALNDEIN